jgi:hypothetical protein
MTLNFAILAIGGMNSMVKLCLDSICQMQNVTLFVMTEKENFGEFSLYGKTNKVKVSLIEPNALDMPTNSLNRFDQNYEIYGTTRFALINTFKWHLIGEVLRQLEYGNELIFSDFDIIWFKRPDEIILKSEETKIFVQSEWQKIDGVKYCTGIIGMVKTNETTETINEIAKFHKAKLSFYEGKYFDQQAFNDFFVTDGNESQVESLPSDTFVIGAEIPRYLIRSFNRVNAMHANYLKGSSRKVTAMKAISMSQKMPHFRVIAAIFIKILLIEGRAGVAYERIKKKVFRNV